MIGSILYLPPASRMIHLGQTGDCRYTQVSSHWTKLTVVLCVQSYKSESCPVLQFLVFSVKHLLTSTACRNLISAHLFYWVCQELKRQNVSFRGSAKARRDPAKIQPSWNVPDCGGLCCPYASSGEQCTIGGTSFHSPAAVTSENHAMAEKPLSLCIISILLEVIWD